MTTLHESNQRPTAARSAATGWRSTFSSLSNRNYRYFWLSTLAWFTGMQMQMFARGWLAYELTKSALAVGMVSAGFGVAILLISSHAGAITDRVEKRNLLMTTQVIAAVINLAVAISISLGAITLWQLIVASVFTGIAMAFNSPGRQSAIPQLVERHNLMNAVALGTGALNLTRVGAPALAGVLVALIGVEWVYYITVIFFGVAGVFMFMVSPMGVSPREGNSSVTRDTIEGFKYVRRNPVILGLLTLGFVPVLFGMPYQALMPVFAAEVLHKGASGLGFLMAAVGIGALIGSLTLASLGNFKRKGLLMLVASTVFGIFLILFAASGQFYLALPLLLAVGTCNTLYAASNNTLVQIHVDDNMRGRVMGIHLVTIGLLPFIVLPVSAVAEAVGVQVAIGAGGVIVILFTLAIAFLRPSLRKL